MVGDFTGWAEGVDAENMIVGHVILVAIVVELNIRLTVMRGVDVNLAVKDVSRGVGGVDIGDERRHGFRHLRMR